MRTHRPLDFASSDRPDRTAVADKVLTHLLHPTTQAHLDTDQLDALNALAAALIAYPADVALLYVDTSLYAPDFLLSAEQRIQRDAPEPELTEAHIRTYETTPKRVGICGTCLMEFSKHPLTIRLRYENLEAKLEVHTPEKASFDLVGTLNPI